MPLARLDSRSSRGALPRAAALGLYGLLLLTGVGCVPRQGALSATQSTYPTSDDASASVDVDSVAADELALLAERLGIGGAERSQVAKPRIPRLRPGERDPFVNVAGRPRGSSGGRGTFGGNSTFGGNGTFGWGGNGTFGRSGNGTFGAGGNGTFGRGGRGSFPSAGGNTTFGGGRFVPIRGSAGRSLPLDGTGSTFGTGDGNGTFPR